MVILDAIKKMQLTTKAVVGVIVLAVLMVLALSVFFILRQSGQIYSDLQKRGLSLAQSTAYNSTYGALIGDEETLLKVIASISEEEDVVYVIIQDMQGNVLAQTEKGIEKEALSSEIKKDVLKVEEPEIFTWKPKGTSAVYDIVVPIISAEEIAVTTTEFSVTEESLFEEEMFGESLEPETSPLPLVTPAAPKPEEQIGVARVGMSMATAESAVRQSVIATFFMTLVLCLILAFAATWLARTLINPLKKLVKNVDVSSTQILSAAEEQAAASAEQSTSLTETSTTVEELAATSKEIADNATTVVSIADQTFQGMEEIKTSTNQAATRILTLGEKSQAIGEIVGVIDDITRQTNLLALNASIEAARAGEAGKGFAVVATEIRKLANNVAGSTNQIKDIIKEIQDATNASILATEEVGKKVETGVDLSQKTTNTAKQISMATQQQRSASEQIVKTIKEMTTVSKQIATNSQQTTVAIKELINIAARIREIMGKQETTT